MKILVIIVIVVATVGAFLLLKNSTSQKTDNANLSVQEQAVTPQSSDTAVTKGNFSQKGNMSAQENGSLWLVWDEPGRMALNVKLNFTGQSICILGGQKKDCSLLDKSGNYYVSIEGNKTGDEVTVTKLEQVEPL